MNEIKIFESEEFGRIRSLILDGEPRFVGKDVADILRYSNTGKAILSHVDEEDREMVTSKTHSQIGNELGQRGGWLINESGLYSLILSSKLPSAKKFKRWVTSEVLPTIRQYGGYITQDTLDELLEHQQKISDFLGQLTRANMKNTRLQNEVLKLKPKARYYDLLIDDNLLINFRTTAKELGIQPMRFINILLDKKYIFRDTKKRIHPMQNYIKKGIFEIKEFTRNGHSGTQTLITPKGRQHFLEVYEKWEI